MTKKLTIEISEDLKKTVKSYAYIKGKTMKEFFIEAVEDSLSKEGISKKENQKTKKMTPKNKKYITEKEADKMLRPHILKVIKRIQNGEEKLYDEDEFFKKLREED